MRYLFAVGAALLAFAIMVALVEEWQTPAFAFSAIAFSVGVVTIIVAMHALRRSRVLADSHAADLERLNSEISRSARRANRLVELTTALSEAQSVDEVTRRRARLGNRKGAC